MDCIVCGIEKSSDYPACSACAKVKHFPYRRTCLHCVAQAEAERQVEPLLRVVEMVRSNGDVPILLADMLDEARRAA